MSQSYDFQPHPTGLTSAHSWEIEDDASSRCAHARCECSPHEDSMGDAQCAHHNLLQAREYAEYLNTRGDADDRAENAAEIAYWEAVLVAEAAGDSLASLSRNRYSLMNRIAVDEQREVLALAQKTAAALGAAWLSLAGIGVAA